MSCKLFGVFDNHDWHYVNSEDRNRILIGFGLPLLTEPRGANRLVHHRVCLKCKMIDNQIARFKAECVRRKRALEVREQLAKEIIQTAEAKETNVEQQDV